MGRFEGQPNYPGVARPIEFVKAWFEENGMWRSHSFQPPGPDYRDVLFTECKGKGKGCQSWSSSSSSASAFNTDFTNWCNYEEIPAYDMWGEKKVGWFWCP